jgi:hypothetical protein
MLAAGHGERRDWRRLRIDQKTVRLVATSLRFRPQTVPRSKGLRNFHVAEIAVEIMSRSGRFVRLLLVEVIAG